MSSNSFSQVPEKKDETPQSGTTPPVAGTTGVEANKTTTTTTPATPPVVGTETTPAATATTPPSDLDEIYSYIKRKIDDRKPESDADKKKRERMEKWEGIISGISDAVSSVGNLYFTSQYAPNMYDPTKSMSAKAKERFEKAKALRDAEEEERLNYMLQYKHLKDADAKWQRQLEQDKIAAEQRAHDMKIADAKEARDAAMFNLNEQLKNHQIGAAEADAKRKGIQAQYEEKYQQARVGKENAAAAASRASAGASNARAGYYKAGGSGKKAEFVSYDKNGKPHYFTDPKAAEQHSRREGTWNDGKSISIQTVTDEMGTKTTTKTSQGNGYSKPKFNVSKHKRNSSSTNKKQGGGSMPPLN